MLHSNKNNTLDFSGQSIYAGIDVHNKMWKICIYCDELELKPMTSPPSPDNLIKHLRKNYPGANYKCAYEAGYMGFWAQHEFKKEGIDCIVVNPADVPSKNKEKMFKTDRIDCRKIARSLRNGELDGIHVPSREELENRNLLRMRQLTVKKSTRIKNQIKAMLSFYGIKISDENCKRSWSKKHIKYLENISMKLPSGNISLKMLLEELKFYNDTLERLTKHVNELSLDIRYREDAENLTTLPGISTLSAMILLTELIDIRRFKSLVKINSFVGFIPSEYSSGEKEMRYGITRRGNPYIKRILIECAWMAIRKDPALLMSFKKYCRVMNSNKAIIKIARKLLNRIRYVLLNKKPYEIGVVK
jgi:transposase